MQQIWIALLLGIWASIYLLDAFLKVPSTMLLGHFKGAHFNNFLSPF